MFGRLLVVLVTCAVLAMPAARAQNAEPNVYFFWSASCEYSKMARSFLLSAQQKDPKLSIREFEIDNSLPNTLLLGRLYERIGLPEFWVVPVVAVGQHIVIGYIDDDTTGQEILSNIAECRKSACPDAVKDLIEQPGRFDEVAASGPLKRIGCLQDRRSFRALSGGRQ